MINAYNELYLESARITLGRMLDYAVYDLEMELGAYWNQFLASPLSRRFELGDPAVVVGRSGVELTLMVLGKNDDYPEPIFTEDKSQEYWLGWALAYYQWETGLPFSRITEYISIYEIRQMYSPYHEMDIRQFCDKMTEIMAGRKQQTNLKQKRLAAGISQSQLALLSEVPVRTIQQYEQGQKNINKAKAEYVVALSRALCCEPDRLLEYGQRNES